MQSHLPNLPTIIAQNYDPTYQGLYLTAFYQSMQVLNYQDWKHLQVLWLRYCRVRADDVRIISGRKWPCLRILSLNMNGIGGTGAKYLVKANLPQLETLELGCQIENEGAKHLLKANWPNLQKLDLKSNHIKNQIFQTLPYTNWKQISSVDTVHQISDEIAILNLCCLDVKDVDIPFAIGRPHIFMDIIQVLRLKFGEFYRKWL